MIAYAVLRLFFEVHYLTYTHKFYCKYTQIFLNLSYLYQNNFYMPNLFRL